MTVVTTLIRGLASAQHIPQEARPAIEMEANEPHAITKPIREATTPSPTYPMAFHPHTCVSYDDISPFATPAQTPNDDISPFATLAQTANNKISPFATLAQSANNDISLRIR
ncbi:hypothetical protein AVEN_21326-1 [Araneus ventricosus]|uniref:Uncharacterized protein n=1 Tax=Araneus ventricosus TaxID=182803 RepID=A0A4Y2XCI1_ARAVE|nr:hypothetical protein AVEN_21326-1 [Araneus ventricosus]